MYIVQCTITQYDRAPETCDLQIHQPYREIKTDAEEERTEGEGQQGFHLRGLDHPTLQNALTG